MTRLTTAVAIATMLLAVIACSFNEYAQSEKLIENIDSHRTGCEIDADNLMTGYKQYDANDYYFSSSFGTPEPTNTPSPITNTEIATAKLLETVWENGCLTGRRDAVGADQATLMGLQDRLDVLAAQINALASPTPTPTPTP